VAGRLSNKFSTKHEEPATSWIGRQAGEVPASTHMDGLWRSRRSGFGPIPHVRTRTLLTRTFGWGSDIVRIRH